MYVSPVGATAIALSFLLATGSPSNLVPVGVVTYAERAQIQGVTLSPGSTIYDGDQLSTDSGGSLRIASQALMLQLDAHSAMAIRELASPENGVQAELTSGTVIFSAARVSKITVMADEAIIRPAANVPTLANVRVVTQKELRIYVQRGAIDFSYRGEHATIPESFSYKVVLDPSEKEAASPENADHKPSASNHAKFLLVAIAVAAAIAIPILTRDVESPDHPGAFIPAASKH